MTGVPKMSPTQLAILEALSRKTSGSNGLSGLFGPPRTNANAFGMVERDYPGGFGLGLGRPRPGTSGLFGAIAPPKRKVFVSYHHGGDQGYCDDFCSRFSTGLNIFSDRTLDRARDSEDPEYIMRYIRENHLTGASTLIVLCGLQTRWRKYVDWEIGAGLRQEMSLVAIKLPTAPLIGGLWHKPDRLQDNVDSGYALLSRWETIVSAPGQLTTLIEAANARPKRLIENSRPRRLRNG
ncbi:MAG TPA: TIR domain-containing protein [Sphingomicrobium sp.]|nr:TIR domain-containing protein [Sphingomicrobium sp.]